MIREKNDDVQLAVDSDLNQQKQISWGLDNVKGPSSPFKSLVMPPSEFAITERSLDMAMVTNQASLLALSTQDVAGKSEFTFHPGTNSIVFTPKTGEDFRRLTGLSVG